jgi:hypothetical protein
LTHGGLSHSFRGNVLERDCGDLSGWCWCPRPHFGETLRKFNQGNVKVQVWESTSAAPYVVDRPADWFLGRCPASTCAGDSTILMVPQTL